MAEQLSPGITAVLDTLANGRELEGRNHRSLEAAVRRGLVVVVGGRPQLTSAGQGAHGLAIPRPDGPDSLDAWMVEHQRRRLAAEAEAKAARRAA